MSSKVEDNLAVGFLILLIGGFYLIFKTVVPDLVESIEMFLTHIGEIIFLTGLSIVVVIIAIQYVLIPFCVLCTSPVLFLRLFLEWLDERKAIKYRNIVEALAQEKKYQEHNDTIPF